MRNVKLQSKAPKTGFGALSPAAGEERRKLTRVLQFGEGAARKIAQVCNSEKARNRIAPQLCISDQGHPRKRAMFCNSEKVKNRTALQSCISGKGPPRKRLQFCNSVKLEFTNEQIS